MSKLVMENCRNISIYKLRLWGALVGGNYSGSIFWDIEHTGRKDNIDYCVNLSELYIKLEYKIKRYDSVEWKNATYHVPLTTTLCNYGEKRYWFTCPGFDNGSCCKRVAKLYLSPNGDRFVCRHCLNLSYKSRNINRKGKFAYLVKFFRILDKLNVW
jgi:hypothetical protein